MAVFCLLCGKRFQAQSALQQHMEVHAGVRSYICSECNRTFPSHTALKRHLRSHTGRLATGGWVGGVSPVGEPSALLCSKVWRAGASEVQASVDSSYPIPPWGRLVLHISVPNRDGSH